MPDTHDLHTPSRWPLDPSMLTNTGLCPACFSALGATLCWNCGLDVGVPEAGELLRAGTAVVTAESDRQRLLAQMRTAQEQRLLAQRLEEHARATSYAFAATAYPAAPFAPEPIATMPHPPARSSAPAQQFAPSQPVPPFFASSPAGMPPVGMPPAQPVRPRRSGIQILMLTVGILLVSVMALFFVLLAYVVASLEVRSVLTGLASAAVFGVAVLLSRRRLQGTAEGLAALAVVLFLLDLWIVRANDLFGTGALDGWLYTGLATGFLAALLALGARLFPLRTLSLSAALLAPVAGFALVHGILADVDAWTRAWAALAAVGAASLAWTRIQLRIERTILRLAGTLATAFAGFCAFGSLPDLDAGATIAFTVLACVWFCTLALSPVAPGTPVVNGADATTPGRMGAWQALAAIGLGLTACGAGLSLLLRSGIEDTAFWLPATVTALAAVAIAGLTRVPRLARLVPALRLAALLPLGVSALAVAPSAVYTVAASAWGAMTEPFSLTAFGSPERTLVPLEFDAPLALLLVSALTLATLAAVGSARRTAWMPAALGGLGLIGACAVLGQPVASAVCLGLLAAALLGGITVARSGSLRAALCSVFALTVLVFGTVGLTSTATFPVTAIATLVLLAAARQAIVRTFLPAQASGMAPVSSGAAAVALVLSARMVPTWFEVVTGTTTAAVVPVLWMTGAALLIGAAIPFAVRILGRPELAVLAAVSLLAAAWGLVELVVQGTPAPLLGALAGTALVGLVWQLRRPVAAWPERAVAAAIAPTATVWAVGVAWSEFDPTLPFAIDPALSAPVVVAATIVVLAACAPPLFRHSTGRPGSSRARLAWDGALTGAAVVDIVWVAARPDLGWLTLVLLSVAALLVASGDGGILSGSSPRRHVAWVGLPLAVAGLWLGLARADATVIEFYTLPVAGLLLGILGLVVARRPAPGVPVERGRTTLLAAAVAGGLGPSAVVAIGDEPLRITVVLLAAAALVITGALAPPTFRGVAGGLVLWAAGVAAAILAGLGSPALHAAGVRIPFEVWSVGSAIILLIAGLLWFEGSRVPAGFATTAVAASVAVLALPTTIALLTAGIDSPALDPWRGILVLVLACGFVVAASVRNEFSPVLRWVSIASAAVVAGALLVTSTVDPFEQATVPLAAALIVGGSVRLARNASRRSWLELGPGLTLLLLPPLAADVGFGTELWRVVALGVVALLVFATGLVLKLQAPTLIGAVVVAVHGLAQLWPWISGLYGSVPWWLWAGVGGVILIVFAATYEARIRDLKAVARGISSLR